jgi:RecA-family ATPase
MGSKADLLGTLDDADAPEGANPADLKLAKSYSAITQPERFESGTCRRDDRPLSARELAEGRYDAPAFLIQGLVLEGDVTLLYGDGGTGKTTLAEQFAVAIAAGKPALGFETKQAPVLLVLAEDDKGVTKQRLETICAQFGVQLEDLPLHVWARPGEDCALASMKDGKSVEEEPFYEQLKSEIRKTGARFVVLDALADFGNIDEIKRQPVNTFLKRVLGGLCRELDVSVLVLAHPSKSGMSDGTYYAGSTAYNNAVRQRLVLAQEGKDGILSKRCLKVAKANYAPQQDIDIYLTDGYFVTAQEALIEERKLDQLRIVLETVKKMLGDGISIVRGNGNGQKPRDIAKAIMQNHRLRLTPQEVLDYLNTLERGGVLGYQKADNSKRGVRTGYFLREGGTLSLGAS